MGHCVRGSPARDRAMEETGCFSSNAPSFFGSILSVPMQLTQPGRPQVPRKAWSQLTAGAAATSRGPHLQPRGGLPSPRLWTCKAAGRDTEWPRLTGGERITGHGAGSVATGVHQPVFPGSVTWGPACYPIRLMADYGQNRPHKPKSTSVGFHPISARAALERSTIHPPWAASKQVCIQGRDAALRPKETVEAWEAQGEASCA